MLHGVAAGMAAFVKNKSPENSRARGWCGMGYRVSVSVVGLERGQMSHQSLLGVGVGGWVDGWMGGWVDGWMGGWLYTHETTSGSSS